MTYFKRQLPAVIAAAVLIGQLTLPSAWAVQSQMGEDAWIIAEQFPDQKLQAWLQDRGNLGGIGADGILTAQERQAVTALNVSRLGLSSLEGLEAFPNLQILDCSQNQLTQLDLTGNPKLRQLHCANNRIQQLDLSQNMELTNLNCNFNRLTRLDLSGHDKLVTLTCEMNYIEELDLSGCTQLIWMYCRNNQLTELDLSDNSKLEFIETFDNRLTEIDVRHLENLRFLHIDHNRLTELDMSHNKKLEGSGFVARNNVAQRIYLPDQPGLIVDQEDYWEQDPIPGHDQVAWYLDEACTQPAPEYLEAQGQTLYSKRIPNRYTIYFSANGGTGAMAGVKAQWGETVELPEQEFRRYGYTFSHWNSQPRGDGDRYNPGDMVENLAGKNTDGDRITLYAQWRANEYTIKLNPNQGQGDEQELKAVYGQPIALPKNTFERENLEFAGWSLTPNGTVRYPDQGQVESLTAQDGGEVVLYAVWRTPLSEIKKPYLEELEQTFHSYSAPEGESKRYTAQDWSTLSQAYAQAASAIEQAETEYQMRQALAQGKQDMAAVPTLADRVEEVTEGWESDHQMALSDLRVKRLNESNAQEIKNRAQAAIEDLDQNQLAIYCPLESAEDRGQVVGLAAVQLLATGEKLNELQSAAEWVLQLDGVTLRPMEQVRGADLDTYQVAVARWEALDQTQKNYCSTSIVQDLNSRYELAGQKRSETMALQNEYDGLDKSLYSQQGQAALAGELEKGLAAIEGAASVAQAQQARQEAWDRMDQIPTAEEETTQPPEPPAGDGGGAGGGNTGGGGAGGGGTTPEKPQEPTEPEGGVSQTITDPETGASALVTTTPDGSVSAEVTVPQGVTSATLRIPCEGKISTVAVLVEADGSRRILPRSMYQDGVLAVRLDRSASIEIVDGAKTFSDVSEKDWFAPAVQFTASRELFSGVGGGTFAPNHTMTRAMLVTVLYQLEGRPAVTGEPVFADVSDNDWYGAAAQWAAEQGITGGTTGGMFSPERAISRESLALMLYRAAGSPELSENEWKELDRFQDREMISPWAREAMAWAGAQGILAGDPQGRLLPQKDGTRAEVSAMLARFVAQTI